MIRFKSAGEPVLPPYNKLVEDILRKEDRIAEILREIRTVLGERP